VDGNGAVNAADHAAIAAALGTAPVCQAAPVSRKNNLTQTYVFAGLSDGVTGYTVKVGFPGPGGVYVLTSIVRPPLPLNALPAAFATDFAAAVNGAAVPGLSAVAVGNTVKYTVTLAAAPGGGLMGGVNACWVTSSQSCSFNPSFSILSTGGIAENPDLSALPSAATASGPDMPSPALLATAAAVLLGAIAAGFVGFRKMAGRRIV
jgi:hypothetical protein